MPDSFDTILELLDYEIWCNLQAVEFLATLSDEEYKRDFGFGLRTPHHTIFHIADVLQGWGGCVGPEIKTPVWLPYRESMTIDEIGAMITAIGKTIKQAARASQEQGILAGERRLTQLFHLMTHGTHHRGQLLSMITLMGYDQPFEGGDFAGWSR